MSFYKDFKGNPSKSVHSFGPTPHCLNLVVTAQIPLIDIVLFLLSPRSFKTCLVGKCFYFLINNILFSSPTNLRSQNLKTHSSNQFEISKPQNPPLSDSMTSPALLVRGFITVVRNVSFSFSINVGSHNLPLCSSIPSLAVSAFDTIYRLLCLPLIPFVTTQAHCGHILFSSDSPF